MIKVFATISYALVFLYWYYKYTSPVANDIKPLMAVNFVYGGSQVYIKVSP